MRCGILWALLTLNLVACANTPPPHEPKGEAPPEASEPESVKAADETDTVSSDGSQSKEADTTAAGTEKSKRRALDETCDKIAERAEQKCQKKVAALYATNCRRYAKSDKCEAEISRLLECQLKTKEELLCAHQADPNCTEATQQLKTCEKGTAPIEQTQAEDLTLPSGWAKISDTQLGFTVALPKGAALDEGASKRTWKAEDGAIKYVVAATDAPAGKLSNASILRTITNYVGTRCQLKLKVHGELDIKGTTVVQYDSGCTDGSERHGMMHFWNGNAVSTGFQSPQGSKGVSEPYYYSFGITK